MRASGMNSRHASHSRVQLGERAAVTLHDDRGGVNYAAAGRYCGNTPTTVTARLLCTKRTPTARTVEREVAHSERGPTGGHCSVAGIFHGDGPIARLCARR